MHLRSGDLKEWRADFQNPSRISLPSTPITNHGSGKHVDIRKHAYLYQMVPKLVLDSGHPEVSTERPAYRMINFYDLAKYFGMVPFNEYFTPVTVPNKVLPILPFVASLVFHLHTFGFFWLSFSVLLCIRSPDHIFSEFDTYTS